MMDDRDRWAEALREYPAWRATFPSWRVDLAAERNAATTMIAPVRGTAPVRVARLQAHGRYMAAIIRAGYDPEED